jgi:hypothetical protein
VNQYRVYYARNWPDALLDRNGADDWPIHYDFAGVFQADDLDGLWALLNQDDRPNAHVERSMCVGDIAIVAGADGASNESRGEMWIARMMGWEKLHRTTNQLVPRVIGVNWPDPLWRETVADEFLER